jgi:hypothetical protein
LRFQRGAYDKPLGCGSNVGERVTRHERQRRIVRRIENPHIVRLHDARPLYVIVKHPVFRRQADLVVWSDVAELAEKRIAVTCQTDVAGFAGQGGAWYVTDGKAKRACVASSSNDGRDAETRDFDATDCRARRGRGSADTRWRWFRL